MRAGDVGPLGQRRAVEVSGLEELTATIGYLEVAGCGCDPAGVLRLFFLDGQWWVNQSAESPSDQSIAVDN